MVLELPELVRENQNWKIYRTHILDSAAVEGVVSHLAGAAPKPVDSCELEAWNWSNSVAKYIIQDVISDSLLMRLMHHELAHSLFSHLAAIFGDHEPIALKPPAEWSDENEPLCEDSHPKSDSTYSARTAAIVEGKHVERAGAAPRIAHDTDRDNDYTISLTFKLKTTNIHDKKPSGTTPAGIPNIPSTPSTNNTVNYPKDPGNPPNVPDGMSRGDIQETAENGRQWQCTTRKVNWNDKTASPAPNLADRTSETSTGDGPVPLSRTRPIKTVKHQHKSTRNIPLPIGRANAIAQRSDRHSKPRIFLPRRHRPPLKGERDGVAANGCTHSSSGRPMPQKLAATSNEPGKLVTISIESEEPDSSKIPRVHLGSVHWHTDDVNCPGSGADASHSRTDRSDGQTDVHNVANKMETPADEAETISMHPIESKPPDPPTKAAHSCANESDGHRNCTDRSTGQTDALNMSSRAGMTGISHCVNVGMYLGARDAKRAVNETDGIGSHVDALTGHEDAHSVATDGLPADEAETVSTQRTESEAPNSPIGTEKWPDRTRHPADTSNGRMDVPSIGNDTRMTTYTPQIVRTRPNDSKSQNSPVETAWQCSDEPNACRHHSDVLSAQTDAPSIQMDALTPANGTEHVRTHQIRPKPPDSPAGSATSRSDATDGFGSHTDTSSVCTDVHCAGNDTQTATNEAESIRTCQNNSKMLNSPHGCEVATPEYIYEWKQVSVGDGDAYLPHNTLIDTRGRKFVFGRVEGGVEVIAPKVVDEMAGDGDGDQNRGDGAVNGTTSSGNVDLTRL